MDWKLNYQQSKKISSDNKYNQTLADHYISGACSKEAQTELNRGQTKLVNKCTTVLRVSTQKMVGPKNTWRNKRDPVIKK